MDRSADRVDTKMNSRERVPRRSNTFAIVSQTVRGAGPQDPRHLKPNVPSACVQNESRLLAASSALVLKLRQSTADVAPCHIAEPSQRPSHLKMRVASLNPSFLASGRCLTEEFPNMLTVRFDEVRSFVTHHGDVCVKSRQWIIRLHRNHRGHVLVGWIEEVRKILPSLSFGRQTRRTSHPGADARVGLLGCWPSIKLRILQTGAT